MIDPLTSLPTLKPHDVADSCFALLDDCDATAADRRSRLYRGFVTAIPCDDAQQLPEALSRMEVALSTGQYAVALLHYELGEQLHGLEPRNKNRRSTATPASPPSPTAPSRAGSQILLFNHCDRLSADEVTAWLDHRAQDQTCRTAAAGIANLRQSVGTAEFETALQKIHAYLEAGDTYQVNYTYRLRFDAFGELTTLYGRLRKRQPAPYGALIALPDGRAVLSLSPELFVQHQHGRLITRPMKGTAAASDDAREDVRDGIALAAGPKDRAENVMIVDLLRNDLGKLATVGSVRVPDLFTVQRHGSVLQMTSTVVAQARQGVRLLEVFHALYPCGSITGAPKRRTMQIIRELETDPRGIYTGAIGWFDPVDDINTMGDFCLSVPIRTLALEAVGEDGVRSGEMGVGAGIVYDSKVAAEYAECQLKAQFLTGMPADFSLFETIHADRASGCRHLDLHLQRLAGSAAYFGFAWDELKIRAALDRTCNALEDGAHRVRLSLQHTGDIDIDAAPLTPITGPVRLLLAGAPVVEVDLFLRHKTSVRARYDSAWRFAEQHGAFDTLFCNRRGELTEGARSNVFLKLEGKWFTPPTSAGLLPGVMRSVLLKDATRKVTERTLTIQDLHRAEEIFVCNALRGVLPATMDWKVVV